MSIEDRITSALAEIDKMSMHQTDGKWLEYLTVKCALFIADWDISECWIWDDWPERGEFYKNKKDRGIDVVTRRRCDGKYVAIQCKSRKLSEDGTGGTLTWKHDLSTFYGKSADQLWSERWVITNGNVSISRNVPQDPNKPIKLVNLKSDLLKQRDLSWIQPPRPDSDGIQTRDSMQEEAVSESVRILLEMANGPTGRARGRIILPCGTGKSRIALRIVERLTDVGKVSVILCPSIALVAQLRREFLAYSQKPMRAIAVCSDVTAGSGSDLSSDPTLDVGQTSASEVKGLVTTDPDTIVKWMDEIANRKDRIGIIFSTYQSSHQISDALLKAQSIRELSVVIADEAHRTAGLRKIPKLEQKIRDFTVCHSDHFFPARFRIYQTATPRVYNLGQNSRKNDKYIVRDMDDQTVFGVELYRKSYVDAVKNQWLSDYRIIALGVNDKAAYGAANAMAADSDNKLSVTNSLRGLVLALVMGGFLRRSDTVIRSSINFVNTIKKSKEMIRLLQDGPVREWVKQQLEKNGITESVAEYRLEHLDAKSRVSAREEAKARLAAATEEDPYGIINVGIFGEGTDAPSLSAVGFLEARKSPIDVIQAVGRVMRRSPNKKRGYIICPIVIPRGIDAETWLRNSAPEDGWKELGQILVALRAHDSRIEDELMHLMNIYTPSPPESVVTMVTLGRTGNQAEYYYHQGKPNQVAHDVESKLKGDTEPEGKFNRLAQVDQPYEPEPERIVSGRLNVDGSTELREDGIQRDKPKADGTPGPINIPKSKKQGREMLNGKAGRIIRRSRNDSKPKKRKGIQEVFVNELFSYADSAGISVNLLEKSGLVHDRPKRDVNILRDSIRDATKYLRRDELESVLDRHFRLDALDVEKRKKQADGCTIASLLLMNACLLHQRIAMGRWLSKIYELDVVKSKVDPATILHRQWNAITRHDFLPVMVPAIEIIEVVRDSDRLDGLNRALRHLVAEAERIAESYADLGADHAGPLFNEVMGNQASDGAFFSRPPIASLLARLSLDIYDKHMINGGGQIGLTAKHGWTAELPTSPVVQGHYLRLY